MEVIIYQNPNGNNVFVCHPSGEIPIENVLVKDCPAGATIVDDSTLPDYDFFDAWELSVSNNNSTVSVNIDKAKNITKTKLRIERAPLLAAQDIAFQRALETNADTASIVTEKQRLRDITKLADSATTLDQLKSLSCKELK